MLWKIQSESIELRHFFFKNGMANFWKMFLISIYIVKHIRLNTSPSVRQSASPPFRQSVSPSVRQSTIPSVRQSVSSSVRQYVSNLFQITRLKWKEGVSPSLQKIYKKEKKKVSKNLSKRIFHYCPFPVVLATTTNDKDVKKDQVATILSHVQLTLLHSM